MGSNPFYFKSRLVNWFHALYTLAALSLVIYNIVYRKYGRNNINYLSMLITSVLTVPIIVDSIYDVAVNHKPSKFTPEWLIVILVAMSLVTLLGSLYVRYVSSRCSSVSECELANGYSRLATDEGDGKRTRRKNEGWRKSHFFVNIVVFSNILIGFVVFSAVMTVHYALRLVSYYDSNYVRELDALYSTLALVGMHLVFVLFDIFFRKTIWGLAIVHHFILGIYILSNVIELHEKQGIIEDVSILVFLCASVPLFVINLVYLLMGRLSIFVENYSVMWKNGQGKVLIEKGLSDDEKTD